MFSKIKKTVIKFEKNVDTALLKTSTSLSQDGNTSKLMRYGVATLAVVGLVTVNQKFNQFDRTFTDYMLDKHVNDTIISDLLD